jgi:hypothetical protein
LTHFFVARPDVLGPTGACCCCAGCRF